MFIYPHNYLLNTPIVQEKTQKVKTRRHVRPRHQKTSPTNRSVRRAKTKEPTVPQASPTEQKTKRPKTTKPEREPVPTREKEKKKKERKKEAKPKETHENPKDPKDPKTKRPHKIPKNPQSQTQTQTPKAKTSTKPNSFHHPLATSQGNATKKEKKKERKGVSSHQSAAVHPQNESRGTKFQKVLENCATHTKTGFGCQRMWGSSRR